MALSDDFKSELNQPRKRKCNLCSIIREADIADSDSILDALSGPLATSTISDVLQQNGFMITVSVVGKHRRENHGDPRE